MENITTIIKREMEKQGMSTNELSQRLGIHPTTGLQMLQKKSMHVQRVAKICSILQYNFFRELAEQTPIDKPKLLGPFKETEIELKNEINSLQNALKEKDEKLRYVEEENKMLKTKLEVYIDVINKIGKV
jgi:transcriptional regulator with XRE-family HTH domain